MQSKPQKTISLIFWTPRILSILFVLFLALFSLDVFEICNGFAECALALFMHNLPALILLILTIVAWKHEIVGAAAFAFGGILYILLLAYASVTNTFEWYYLGWSLNISGPAFIIACLYWRGWKQKTTAASQIQKPAK